MPLHIIRIIILMMNHGYVLVGLTLLWIIVMTLKSSNQVDET